MSKSLEPSVVETTAKLVDYQPGSIVSRVILKASGGNVTLFAFDAGQGLSEHTAPFDALVQILDGTAQIQIGGETHMVSGGQCMLLPANVPHALEAQEPFKMTLTMIRAKE